MNNICIYTWMPRVYMHKYIYINRCVYIYTHICRRLGLGSVAKGLWFGTPGLRIC